MYWNRRYNVNVYIKKKQNINVYNMHMLTTKQMDWRSIFHFYKPLQW